MRFQSERAGSTLNPTQKDDLPRHVTAFDDDFDADPYAFAELDNDAQRAQFFARAGVSENAVVSIPPAEMLDASGSNLDDLSLTWLAPAHTHIGASAVSGGGAWYVYASATDAPSTRVWPHLPEGISLADLGFDQSAPVINVFAATQPVGVPPWEWSKLNDQLAVVRSFGPNAALPPEGEGGAGGTTSGGAAGERGTAGDEPRGGESADNGGAGGSWPGRFVLGAARIFCSQGDPVGRRSARGRRCRFQWRRAPRPRCCLRAC